MTDGTEKAERRAQNEDKMVEGTHIMHDFIPPPTAEDPAGFLDPEVADFASVDASPVVVDASIESNRIVQSVVSTCADTLILRDTTTGAHVGAAE